MYWQQLWFLSNMLFVTLMIVFLFMHHAVTLARRGEDAALLARKRRMRLIFAVLTIVSLIVMIVFFLINMRVNR